MRSNNDELVIKFSHFGGTIGPFASAFKGIAVSLELYVRLPPTIVA